MSLHQASELLKIRIEPSPSSDSQQLTRDANIKARILARTAILMQK